MNHKQARVELDQYVRRHEYRCPGACWERYGRHDPLSRGEWGHDGEPYCTRGVVVSLQLCLPWGHRMWPEDYAAQVNYNRAFQRLYADAGQTVRQVPPPPSPSTGVQSYDDMEQAKRTSPYERLTKAIKATDPEWWERRRVEWARLPTTKRRRRGR